MIAQWSQNIDFDNRRWVAAYVQNMNYFDNDLLYQEIWKSDVTKDIKITYLKHYNNLNKQWKKC